MTEIPIMFFMFPEKPDTRGRAVNSKLLFSLFTRFQNRISPRARVSCFSGSEARL